MCRGSSSAKRTALSRACVWSRMSGLSYTISQITEELSTDECKRLSYLCGDLDPDRFSADPRGTLHTLLSQTRVDGVFLMELVLKIKRYDLLREVLSTSKSSVEGMLRTRQAVPEYRSLMADVSEDMDTEDLKSLSFLLRGTIPKQKLENVQSFLDIVVELEKLDQLSSEKTGFIEGCLRSIHRTDLARKISRFQHTAVMANPEVCPPERAQHFRPPAPHTSSGFSSGFSSGSCKERQTRKFCDTQTPVKKQAPRSGSGCQEEVYRMTDPRGVCLIIDCVGTEGDDLEQVFLALRFSVTLHRLLSERELESALRAVSRQQELHTAGVFSCCIISRSRSSLLLATDPLAPGLSLDALRTLFSPRSCPGLAGKPKLFFIQSYEECEACVGPGDGELETDGPVSSCRSRAVPEDADVFWSHCWTDGHQLETPGHRSVYLQTLRASLTDTHKRTHLIDMHTAVNRAVYEHNRRSAESSYIINLRHTLRKTLYLS